MGTILEGIFTAAIVILLLLFFGVPLESIITVAAAVMLGLVALAMLLFAVFFIVTDISLLFKRHTKGIFQRVDDTGRFDHAVYKVDDQEYACSFPAESFGRKRIYQENHAYFLLIPRNPKHRYALDRHSMVVIVIGNLFTGIFLAALIALGRYVLTLMG